jgi:DNA (cytosine-5)-methyltransferase 1
MKVGSLFSGYGGLDMSVGGDLAWYAEVEPAAIKVMEAHHPGVPNLGDVTKVDWSQVEPVDVITGGYPCQPFSNAGKRKGKDDDRHLWPYVRDAISAIRPKRAVLENVRGHLSLGFADVLADLAGLGLSARWGVVRAADAGAPHNRARLFIVAYPQRKGLQGQPQRSMDSIKFAQGGSTTSNPSSKRHGSRQRPTSLGRVDRAHEGSARERQRSWQEPGTGSAARWGQYAPAIDRWERVIGRSAPAPTIQRAGRDRLNPVFVEWMMGLPKGWVTGHGLSASQELKMLGNGVVPQQAALALRLLGAA